MPQSPNDILYFCDESSQVDDDFMAVGGLAITRARLPSIVERLDAIRAECQYHSEVKWNSAKKRRMSIHKAYADYLAELVTQRRAHLHLRFAPFGQYDHRSSGPRGRKDTVSKMYYQLLLHRPVAFYGPKLPIFVHPDEGDCTSYLQTMRGALCAAGYRRKGCRPDCVKVIEPRPSHREPLLQLLDVTLGAFTAMRNKRELGEAKADLAAHIHAIWGKPDTAISSDPKRRPFNIWNATPSR